MPDRAPLTVMTYNLRFDCAQDRYPWRERRPLVVDLVAEAAPTVLGTQEGLRHQVDDLAAGLPDWYAWVGQSRSHPGDEYGAVFYDTRRLEVVDVVQRWLSATPETPGSVSWGTTPRVFTAVGFRERPTDSHLLVINTHLDHLSAEAREHAADQLADYVQGTAGGRPTVLLGDFNAPAHISSVARRLAETPMFDTFAAVPGAADQATFTDYQPPPVPGARIDWILVSPDIDVMDTRVNVRNFDGRFASDHLPVEATLRIPERLKA